MEGVEAEVILERAGHRVIRLNYKGGGMCSKLDVQFIIEAKIWGVQNHHFIYYQPKYWVLKCAPLRIRFRRRPVKY